MKSLDEILLSFDENTQNVLFLNGKGPKHPVWDDAHEVFAKAVEQILDKSLGLQKGVDYSKTPKFYGARPLAFIGVHAQMIGRKSIGFLLTQRHLLVKFDASATNADEAAAAFRLGKYLQNELENLAWQELEKCEFEIEDEMKAAMKRALKAVLNAIFEKYQTIIARWDVATVAAEVESALQIQEDLAHQAEARLIADKKEARKEARREKFDKLKADIKEKFDKLKADVKEKFKKKN